MECRFSVLYTEKAQRDIAFGIHPTERCSDSDTADG